MNQHSPKKYTVVGCAVLQRELYLSASRSNNIINIKILPQGLHDVGECKMSGALQTAINELPVDDCDGILLAYGLCNNGIRGLKARVPLVAPRAHDCITLLMGSKEKYKQHFNNNPGTYYRSIGWAEQDKSHLNNPDSTTTQLGMSTYEEYVEKYGEEDAEYLMETMGDWLKHYSKMAYIDTQTLSIDPHQAKAIEEAKKRGWQFESIQGNVNLLSRMMAGDWREEDFLVIPPGQSILPSHDDKIIKLNDKS